MPISATRKAAAPRAFDGAGLLDLAAAPVFGLMAGYSALAAPDMAMCGAGASVLPINDMALMYLLMGLFHLPPWIRLSSARSRHRPSLAPKT
jgi:hypothetical protein